MKSRKSKEVIRILKRDGWQLVKIKGSHYHFKHPVKKGKVTVPYRAGSENLKIKTLKSILKQASINQKEIRL